MTARTLARAAIATLLAMVIALTARAAFAGGKEADPSGGATGDKGNIPTADPANAGNPTPDDVANAVGKSLTATNHVWTLVTGFLVMFMQLGFALLETGFTRKKNAAHTLMMNFMIYAIGMLGYWAVGFALQFGGFGGSSTLGGGTLVNKELTITIAGKPFGLFGYSGFFLSGVAYDAAIYTLFLFQMVFMATAAIIPTGAMAERLKFKAFFIYGFFISTFVYPLFGNWAWGGGWLAQLGTNFGLGHGYCDFAGSGVVHMVGGWTALAGAMALGPRIGKFGKDGKPVAIPGHSLPLAIAGTLILAFGWFGFNPGSTLAGTDLRIGIIATNTMLASAAGAVAAALYMWGRSGKPDPAMSANGMLAGLVAITAPCAFVGALAAVFIGTVAGILVCWSSSFLENQLKVDDPVGAIPVHAFCGAWGVLALGLFADGTYGEGQNGVAGSVKGLLFGDAKQFVAQIVGVAVNFGFVFFSSKLFFKVLDKTVGLRVSREVELAGLDLPELGVTAYPDDWEPKEE